MIEAQGFVFEDEQGEDHEYDEGDDFLEYFELPEIEGAAVFAVSDSIGWDLRAVFYEGDAPAEEDDAREWKLSQPGYVFEFEVSVPGDGHEYIGEQEQGDGVESFHRCGRDCKSCFVAYWIFSCSKIRFIFGLQRELGKIILSVIFGK